MSESAVWTIGEMVTTPHGEEFPVDAGIGDIVQRLQDAYVATFSSCAGQEYTGDKSHGFARRTVRFDGDAVDAQRAQDVLESAGYCMFALTFFPNKAKDLRRHSNIGSTMVTCEPETEPRPRSHWGGKSWDSDEPRPGFWQIELCPHDPPNSSAMLSLQEDE